MTLSLPNSAVIKQYLPGVYFIAIVAFWVVDTKVFWITLFAIPFLVQMVLNNRYLNLILGVLMILWSVYMGLAIFLEVERTLSFISASIAITIANLYMSRMMFLNQNFAMAALRENSLDDTMFI